MIKVTNKFEIPSVKTVYDLRGGAPFFFYDNTDDIYLLSEEEDFAICLTDGIVVTLREDGYPVEAFERVPVIECDITLEIGKISK